MGRTRFLTGLTGRDLTHYGAKPLSSVEAGGGQGDEETGFSFSWVQLSFEYFFVPYPSP